MRACARPVAMVPSPCISAGPDVSVSSDGVRLYFEVRDLDDFCRKLQQKGFYITQTAPHDALGLAARLCE